MAGYHEKEIKKGILGQYSKVIEEFEEFSDSMTQDCIIMAILELSDLIGSARYYYYDNNKKNQWDYLMADLFIIQHSPLPMSYSDLNTDFQKTLDIHHDHHWIYLSKFITHIDLFVRQYNLTMRDLVRMSSITERAFLSGQRT